jgi:hypothetical protein
MERAMPEPTDDELGIPEGLDPNIRAELRKSRELARDLDAANKRAAEAERSAAFSKAGVPDTPLAAQLAKTYEGDNDPAAVKAYFESLGVNLGSGGTQQEDEAALEEQRRLAQVGSQGSTGGDIRFEDALTSAKNKDEVMALLAAAPEGATDYEGRRIGVPRID